MSGKAPKQIAICGHCSLSFTSLDKLKTHMKEEHVPQLANQQKILAAATPTAKTTEVTNVVAGPGAAATNLLCLSQVAEQQGSLTSGSAGQTGQAPTSSFLVNAPTGAATQLVYIEASSASSTAQTQAAVVTTPTTSVSQQPRFGIIVPKPAGGGVKVGPLVASNKDPLKVIKNPPQGAKAGSTIFVMDPKHLKGVSSSDVDILSEASRLVVSMEKNKQATSGTVITKPTEVVQHVLVENEHITSSDGADSALTVIREQDNVDIKFKLTNINEDDIDFIPKHVKPLLSYQCNKCDYKDSSYRKICIHVTNFHLRVESAGVSERGSEKLDVDKNGVYRCVWCPQSFVLSGDRDMHALKCGPKRKYEVKRSAVRILQRNLRCKRRDCGRPLYFGDTLPKLAYKRAVYGACHRVEGDGHRFECYLCAQRVKSEEKTSDKKDINEEGQSVDEQQPMVITEASSKFEEWNDLLEHLQTYHADTLNENPKCDECSEEIYSNINMCKHLFLTEEGYNKHRELYNDQITISSKVKKSEGAVKYVFGQRGEENQSSKDVPDSTRDFLGRKSYLKALKAQRCRTCGKTFSSITALERHTQGNQCVRAVERIHSCKYCNKRFARTSTKISHESWCAYKSTAGASNKFNAEIISADGKNKKITEFVLDRESDAIKKGTYSKQRCKIPGCVISVPTEKEMEVHLKCHLNGTLQMQCSFCDFRPAHTVAWFPLKEHIIAKHKGILEPRFQCMICDKGFAKKHKIMDHLQTHSDVRTAVCAICGADFKQESSLRVHVLETHGTDEQRGNALDKKRRHMENRNKSQKLCYICGYTTSSRGYFNTHMNIHKGIKPFSCEFCEYATVDSACYRRHMWRHKSDKPYQCSECGYTAIQKSQLNLHIKTKHGGEGSNVAKVPRIRTTWSKNKIAWSKQTLDDVLKSAGIEGSVEVTTVDADDNSVQNIDASGTVEIQIGDTVVVATQEDLTYSDYVSAYSYGAGEVEPEAEKQK